MHTGHHEAVIHQYIAAYNAFDVEGMLSLLSSDVRFENWSGDAMTAQASGIAAFAALARQAKALFAEREQTITALREEGDATVVEIAYRGVLACDIPDGPPAGTVISLNGQTEFRFDGGRIASIIDRS